MEMETVKPTALAVKLRVKGKLQFKRELGSDFDGKTMFNTIFAFKLLNHLKGEINHE